MFSPSNSISGSPAEVEGRGQQVSVSSRSKRSKKRRLLAKLVAREHAPVMFLDRLVERVLQHRGDGRIDDVAVLGQRPA